MGTLYDKMILFIMKILDQSVFPDEDIDAMVSIPALHLLKMIRSTISTQEI